MTTNDLVEHERVDVINSSDFRLPGGTSHSVAQEVTAQAKAGFTTKLLHVESALIRRPLPWSEPILSTLHHPLVSVVSRTRPVHTKLLILRHPSAYTDPSRLARGISADRIVMVTNHAANDADGHMNYDVSAVDEIIRSSFGQRPVWAPIGPVARESLLEQQAKVSVTPEDWLNVIELSASDSVRSGLVTHVPVLGRHSRPQAAKWPTRPKDIRDAYPLTPDFKVRILGGAEAARDVLGKVPARWDVIPFGGEHPSEFLKTIDFWVYFHHDNTREAYGRAIVEALASGAVVVLPEYLQATYGDAAVYGRPADVREIVKTYTSDVQEFLRQSVRGQQFAKTLSPSLHLERLRALEVVPAARAVGSGDNYNGTERRITRRKVLFITSNGAGMGHLTRLLAVARQLPGSFEAMFASLSTGVPVVAKFDFPFEYIASSDAMGMEAAAWNAYFASRLAQTIDNYLPDTVVFDGTVPYAGLLEAMGGRKITKVWMRRPMWKAELEGRQLSKGQKFDLIIEPGELAAEYDRGATTRVSDAVRVGPVSLLSKDEVLPAEDARDELGYGANERVALITLGAGNINDISTLQMKVISWFEAERPEWRVVVTAPPISSSPHDSRYETLRTYPLAKYSRAFDCVVSAAGYNSFHEWMKEGVPALWIPNTRTLADDQVARALWAQDSGLGGCYLEGEGSSLKERLRLLTSDHQLSEISGKLASLKDSDGSAQAAALLVARTEEGRGTLG